MKRKLRRYTASLSQQWTIGSIDGEMKRNNVNLSISSTVLARTSQFDENSYSFS